MANGLTNDSAYNLSFHLDYRDSLNLGIRVPLDDRGSLTNKDRPFALGNHIIGWKEGSANMAVKKLWDIRSGNVDASDLADYNAGILDLRRLNKYIDNDMLYGFNGDARGRVPNDLMSYRGYPTYEITDIVYESIELNQDTVITQNTGNEKITSMNDNIFNQVVRDYGTTFPITVDNDYVIMSGYVDLKNSVPFDTIYIALKQKIAIQNTITQLYEDMWSGTYTDDVWVAKTECHNNGSNTRFYFRIEAELSNAVLDDGIDFGSKTIFVKVEEDVTVAPYGDDFWYGSPIIATTGVQLLGVSYVGGKWVGSGGVVPQDVNPPSVPQNLTIISNVSTDLRLGWDASTDDFGVREYEISVTKFGNETTYITTNTFLDLIVEGGAEYTFKVRAYDYAYNVSAYSTPLVYTTEALVLEIVYGTLFGQSTSALACADNSIRVARYVFDKLAFLNGTYTEQVYNNSDGSVVFDGNNDWYNFAKTIDTTVWKSVRLDGGFVVGFTPC